MTGSPEALSALALCAKYERTLIDCFRGYHLYFKRWRLHRPEEWFKVAKKLAHKRLCKLELRINWLDTLPGDDRFEFELEPLDMAQDFVKVIGYFVEGDDKGLLNEARAAYRQGIERCKEGGDPVSAGLLGCLLCEVEDGIQRFESKRKKIQLVGAEMYIGLHFRGDQGGS